jgi:alpha-L-fucosidase
MTLEENAMSQIVKTHFDANWDSLHNYEVPEWYRDAKLGIWAHWSPQCVPEMGDWYARNMYIQGHLHYQHHLDHYGHPTRFGYKDICNLWKAENWDPESLIERYKRAGAKYFTALGNHHCNFDMWNSRHHPWNSVNVGPMKDIVGRWEKTARAQGLRFGITLHSTPSRTWRQFFPVTFGADKDGPLAGVPYDGNLTKADGKGLWWEGLDPQELYTRPHPHGSDPDPEFVENVILRVKDVIDQYHPDLLYFDDALQPVHDLETYLGMQDIAPEIAAYYYNASLEWLGKIDVVLNIKDVPEYLQKTVVQDMERRRFGAIEPYPWQTDTCIGAWHYQRDIKYKGVREKVTDLIDIVSKNGNMLLNIPMRGDGTIDEEEERFLESFTLWMDINGEGIYSTRPWMMYGEGPSTQNTGKIWDSEQAVYTAQDIRFTRKANDLFAFLLAWPKEGQAVIKSLKAGSSVPAEKILAIRMLGTAGELAWRQDEQGLHVQLPAQRPCDYAYTLKIEQKEGQF